MNLCTVNLFSAVLRTHVQVEILLPSMPEWDAMAEPDLDKIYEKKTYPVLFLLHGAFDDGRTWIRRTNIEEYAQNAGVLLVMPSCENSFYTDEKYGKAYFTFLTEELPRFLSANFPVKEGRENTFIAGASMGGYGAAKCALTYPDRFAACGILSGAVDPPVLEPLLEAIGRNYCRYDLIFGGTAAMRGTRDDIFVLAEELKDAKDKPFFSLYCAAEEDINMDMSHRLEERLIANGAEVSFGEGHGEHGWSYWDGCIRDFVNRLFPETIV